MVKQDCADLSKMMIAQVIERAWDESREAVCPPAHTRSACGHSWSTAAAAHRTIIRLLLAVERSEGKKCGD